MAITNAQQYQQILQKMREAKAFGGVMGLDGRRQYGGGSDFGQVADSSGKTGPGTGGYQGGPLGGYGDAGNTGNGDGGTTNQFEINNPEKLKKEQQALQKEKERREEVAKEKERLAEIAKEKRKENTTVFGTVKDFFSKIKNKTIQKTLDRNKLLAMKKLNLTKTLNPFAKVPDWAKDLTEEELVGIATTGPYLGQQKTKADVSKFADGKDLLGRVFEGQSILNTGSFPQSEYERLFPSNLNVGGGGGGGGDNNYVPPIIPEDDTTEEDTTPTRNLGGLAPRFAGSIFDFTGLADGGIARAGAMDGGRMMRMMANEEEDDPTGGIMDLESGRQMYFLGKLVKKATRAIKKVAKSPIGKAALLYFGGNALMGAGGGGGLSSLFKSGKGLSLKNLIMGKPLGFKTAGDSVARSGGLLNFMKDNPYLSILGGSSILAGLSGKGEDDGFDIDEYYRTAGLGGQEGIDATRAQGLNALATRFRVADGGRINYAEGSKEPVAKETMPLLDMDNQEMDLRAEGGFVPIGRMERADDVPARLSKNEFVFTADAVRNAGEGDIDKGAEVMYNMMKNLESGGEVSEESQGLDGAREMFKTSQRLEEVL